MILFAIVLVYIVAVLYREARRQKVFGAKDAVILPISGLMSMLGGLLIGKNGFNVHSGEVILWIAALMLTFIVLPVLCFVKSVKTIITELGQEKSAIRTYTIALTVILGTALICVLLGLVVLFMK